MLQRPLMARTAGLVARLSDRRLSSRLSDSPVCSNSKTPPQTPHSYRTGSYIFVRRIKYRNKDRERRQQLTPRQFCCRWCRCSCANLHQLRPRTSEKEHGRREGKPCRLSYKPKKNKSQAGYTETEKQQQTALHTNNKPVKWMTASHRLVISWPDIPKR